MKKTIIAITLFSFSFLSLNVHMHEHEHAEHSDHVSKHNTLEQDCNFCQFNSENSSLESSTTSLKINFKVLIFEQYVTNYISFNIFCFLNKSPPQ